MRTALSVTSLWMKRTCPGPPGEYKIRQWLTRVICGPFSSSCKRIKEFSPVRRTWLGSVSGMHDLLCKQDDSVVGYYDTRIWLSLHLPQALKPHIRQTLGRYGWSHSRAAKCLGSNRTTL